MTSLKYVICWASGAVMAAAVTRSNIALSYCLSACLPPGPARPTTANPESTESFDVLCCHLIIVL
jgi:hypothetical protein